MGGGGGGNGARCTGGGMFDVMIQMATSILCIDALQLWNII